MEEHKLILEKLDALKTTLVQPLNDTVEDVDKAISFIQEYADEFHHAKEENIYFKWICEQNPMFKEDGPVTVMLNEHDQGRALIKEASLALDNFKNGDNEQQSLVKSNLRNFIELLNDHINKENNILYPMAEDMDYDGDGDNIMLPQFNKVEQEYLNK